MSRTTDKASDIGRCAGAVGPQREVVVLGLGGRECRIWWRGLAMAARWSCAGGHCQNLMADSCNRAGSGRMSL
jgi:hypothetical protein